MCRVQRNVGGRLLLQHATPGQVAAVLSNENQHLSNVNPKSSTANQNSSTANQKISNENKKISTKNQNLSNANQKILTEYQNSNQSPQQATLSDNDSSLEIPQTTEQISLVCGEDPFEQIKPNESPPDDKPGFFVPGSDTRSSSSDLITCNVEEIENSFEITIKSSLFDETEGQTVSPPDGRQDQVT